jgi:NADPH2:quinone reductase
MVIEAFGGPERLKAAEIPTPAAEAEEVLIAVACASVNPVDWQIREGMLADMFPHSFPLVPGWDAAGTVSAVGRNADRFKSGDKVFAYCRKPQVQFGTYCEYVAVHESAVALMPGNLGFAEAATVPLAGLTAWQSLFDTAKLSAGEKILIHAGSGGVGSLAIQLAKHAGATVYTTARAVNHDYVRGLGADTAIDYTKENFVDVLRKREPAGIDVVYDTIGSQVQRRSYEVLRKGGRLVSIISIPDAEEARPYDVRTAFVFVSPNGKQLRKIAELIESGAVRPAAFEVMRLEDAAKAQELSRQGYVRGKIVLKIR